MKILLLLFTVIIILILLLISVYFLNKSIKKKESPPKEEFFDGGGDIYSLQWGENEFQTITRLESDVNNIIVKQEENATDLMSFKTDTTNQISNLNTGITQFKTDTSGKLSTLQETINSQDPKLTYLDKNLNDLTKNVNSSFKSTNDNFAVINGQIISIKGAQQKQIDSLTNNYNVLSQQQSSFPKLVDSKNKEVLDQVNANISKITTNFNSAIEKEKGLINNASNQIASLQQDYQSFKTNTSQIDGNQQASINQLLTSAASLNEAINAAQKRISDVAATFGNYISKDQTGDFVVKADLQPYATQNQLQNYAKNTITAEFTTFNELGRYVTKMDNQPIIDSLKTIEKEYVSKNQLQTTVDSLNEANSALAVLSNTVKTISANYVTKTDLPKLALQNGGTQALNQALDGMKGTVTTLTNSIADLKAGLTNYVLKSDWNNLNKTFALKSDLNTINSKITAIDNNLSQNVAMKGDLKGYVKLSQMPQWPTKSDIDALTNNFNAQIASIKGGTSNILTTLQVNKLITTDQIIATKGLWNSKMPTGWTGGVHTFDLYGEGIVGAGKNGNVNAYINSTGSAKIGNNLGVGIDPSNMGSQKFRVETPTKDWQNLFHNPNGNRNVYFNHGDGYGIHVNVNDQRGDHYGLQVHNGKTENLTVFNDGQIRWNNRDGKWTHFNHPDEKGKNYIRGPTQIDAPYLGVNGLRLTQGWTAFPDKASNQSEISNDTAEYKELMIVGNKSAKGNRKVGVWDTLTVHGSFNNQSDERLKTNIEPILKNNYKNIDKLEPKSFTWKNDSTNKPQYGFIAQDVEKVYPDLITDEPNGYKTMNYIGLIPLTVANIKDLKQNLPDKETLCLGDVCINKDQLLQIKKALET